MPKRELSLLKSEIKFRIFLMFLACHSVFVFDIILCEQVIELPRAITRHEKFLGRLLATRDSNKNKEEGPKTNHMAKLDEEEEEEEEEDDRRMGRQIELSVDKKRARSNSKLLLFGLK